MKFVNEVNTPDPDEIKKFEDLQRRVDEEKPITMSRPVEPEKPNIKNAKTGKVNRMANLRKSPDPTSEILDVAMIGSKADILGSDRGYYKVKYGVNTGYIKKNCVDEVW